MLRRMKKLGASVSLAILAGGWTLGLGPADSLAGAGLEATRIQRAATESATAEELAEILEKIQGQLETENQACKKKLEEARLHLEGAKAYLDEVSRYRIAMGIDQSRYLRAKGRYNRAKEEYEALKKGCEKLDGEVQEAESIGPPSQSPDKAYRDRLKKLERKSTQDIENYRKADKQLDSVLSESRSAQQELRSEVERKRKAGSGKAGSAKKASE